MLLVGVVCVVTASTLGGYVIYCGLRLHPGLALLVACGSSICDNYAISARAPGIGAAAEDISTSIVFTAVLGLISLGLIRLNHVA